MITIRQHRIRNSFETLLSLRMSWRRHLIGSLLTHATSPLQVDVVNFDLLEEPNEEEDRTTAASRESRLSPW